MSDDPTVFDDGHGPLSSDDEVVAAGAGVGAGAVAYRLTGSELAGVLVGGAVYKLTEGAVD